MEHEVRSIALLPNLTEGRQIVIFDKNAVPITVNNAPENKPKTAVDFSKDTGLNLRAAQVAIARAMKADPTIEAKKLHTGTKHKTLSFLQSDYEKLLAVHSGRKNQKKEPKMPDFFLLSDGDRIPLLKGEKQGAAANLLIEARVRKKPISLQKISKTVYSGNEAKEANRKVRSLLHKIRREWEPWGWTIDHPIYLDSSGKLRRVRGFLELRREDEQPTRIERAIKPSLETLPQEVSPPRGEQKEKKGRKKRASKMEKPVDNPGLRSSVSKSIIPQLPSESFKPTTPPTTIWEPPQARKEIISAKDFQTLKENLQQQTILDYVMAVLSLYKTGQINKLDKTPTKTFKGQLPRGVSFDWVLGIDPKEDKQTKNRQRKEFFIHGLNVMLSRLSETSLEQITKPEERKIKTRLMNLEQLESSIEDILTAVSKRLGVEIPDRSKSMVA